MLHRIELQHRPHQIFSATLQRCFAWAGGWVARVWKEKRVFKCVYPPLLMSGSGAKQKCPHTFRQQSESAVATLLHWRGGCSGLRDNNISLNWYSRYSSTGLLCLGNINLPSRDWHWFFYISKSKAPNLRSMLSKPNFESRSSAEEYLWLIPWL